jgi:hypothetical protein
MKKLLILTAMLILTTSAGCCNCGWCHKGAAAPCNPPCAAPCSPCSPCESAPCMTPGPVVPGPEAYVAPGG